MSTIEEACRITIIAMMTIYTSFLKSCVSTKKWQLLSSRKCVVFM